MADGTRFDIAIEAQSIGLSASAIELTQLVERMTKMDAVATQFDTAVAAASARLKDASDAAQLASTEFAQAQDKYNGLEAAANRASAAFAKASASKKTNAAKLAELKEEVERTTTAMNAQVGVVDALKAKSVAAAGAQAKMADALSVLKAKQAAAAAEIKKSSADQANAQAKAAQLAQKSKLQAGADKAALMGRAAAAAAVAFVAVGAAILGAVYNLGKFAIAAQPAAMMRLQMASMRLQLSFQKLFRGLNLNPLLGALERMGALFDESNTSGKALKVLIETLFQPLINAIGKAEPYFSEFFKGMVHGALLVVIAILKIRNAIWAAMSPETRAYLKALIDKVFTMENAFKLGTVAGVALAVILGVVALAFVAVGISILVMMIPFFLFWAAVIGIVKAVQNWGKVTDWLKEKWDAFKKWMSDLATDALSWGKNIIDGIINGVTGRTKDLGSAMKSAAALVQSSFEKKLEIHSPSRVMFRDGVYTADGAIGGVESRMDDAADAGSSLGEALAGGTSSSSTSTTTNGGAKVVHIHQLTIGNSPVAADSWAKLRELILSELEGAVLEIGGGEAPAT